MPRFSLLFALCLLITSTVAISQPIKNRGCAPVSERTAEVGCWILEREQLRTLPKATVFWHIDTYPNRAAALAAKGPTATVVEALGQTWLFTIGEESLTTRGGTHVATIGPLAVTPGEKYIAQYMEGVTTPGTTTPVHRHPGPEVWYTLAGQACLETPAGKAIARAGQSITAPEGAPMRLMAIGKEQAKWLVLVLHRASQHWEIAASDWTPTALCEK